MLCDHTLSSCKVFHIPQMETIYLSWSSPFPSPSALATTHLHLLSTELPVWIFPCNLNHTIYSLSWLASWLSSSCPFIASNIPLYGYTTIYWSIHLLIYIWIQVQFWINVRCAHQVEVMADSWKGTEMRTWSFSGGPQGLQPVHLCQYLLNFLMTIPLDAVAPSTQFWQEKSVDIIKVLEVRSTE